MPNTLPTMDEKGDATNFSGTGFEQARNAVISYAYYRYQRGVEALAADPRFNEYRPAYRATR